MIRGSLLIALYGPVIDILGARLRIPTIIGPVLVEEVQVAAVQFRAMRAKLSLSDGT